MSEVGKFLNILQNSLDAIKVEPSVFKEFEHIIEMVNLDMAISYPIRFVINRLSNHTHVTRASLDVSRRIPDTHVKYYIHMKHINSTILEQIGVVSCENDKFPASVTSQHGLNMIIPNPDELSKLFEVMLTDPNIVLRIYNLINSEDE